MEANPAKTQLLKRLGSGLKKIAKHISFCQQNAINVFFAWVPPFYLIRQIFLFKMCFKSVTLLPCPGMLCCLFAVHPLLDCDWPGAILLLGQVMNTSQKELENGGPTL